MTETVIGTDGALETEKDAGKGVEGEVKRWLMELSLADKREKGWRKQAGEIEKRYRAEGQENAVTHNILYSNVETMRPALYDSTPIPDIRRRFRDKDPVGKQIAEVMERAVSHQIDINDLDGIMQLAILDYLLPGRAVVRERYIPTFSTIPEQRTPFEPQTFDGVSGDPDVPENAVVDENGQIFIVQPEREVLVDEETYTEYVHWRDFRMGPGRTWDDVKWISFDFRLTRKQAVRMFGARIGNKLPLTMQLSENHDEDKKDGDKVEDVFKRGLVREIWDKDARKVRFVSPGLPTEYLLVIDDPLQLENFWPMPRPMYAVESTESMVPTAEYYQYKSQAEELDLITKRIRNLIKALKYRGVYDATIQEVGRIMDLGDNEFIATENTTQFMDKGGLEKAFFFMPIDEIAKVLANLYIQRDQIKDTIFEITGLSDILRGVSDSSETATAQNIKSQFGSLRINRRQREVQRFVRDIIRLKAEIITEHFQPETIQKITQMQVTPEMVQIMRDDRLRSYRVDIETDSTIAKQITSDEQNITQLLQGIGQFIKTMGPAVVSGFIPQRVAADLLNAAIRRFKLGRSVEESMGELQDQPPVQQPQDKGPSPEEQAAAQQLQLKGQEMEARLRLDAQKLQLTQGEMQAKLQGDEAKMNLEAQKVAADIQLKREIAQAELDLKREIGLAQIEAKRAADSEPKTSVSFDTKGQLEDTFGAVLEAVAGMQAQNTAAMTQAVQLMAQATQGIADAVAKLNAPKKVVFDKTGRPIGIEPEGGE